MHRSLFAAALPVALLAASPGAHAELTNEPAGFRGIEWGAPLEKYEKELTFIRRDGDVAVYRRTSDALSLGQAKLVKVAYRFYKGQFSTGIIQSYGKDNAAALRSYMIAQHGEPVKPYKHVPLLLWDGAAATLFLTCEITTYCAGEFASKAVLALEQAETGETIGRAAKDD